MKTFKCTKISGGRVEAEVIVSKDAVCFYLVEPATGIVVEKNHDILNQTIANKILIMPSGKGSSVVQADGLYKLSQNKLEPKGIIVEQADTVLVSSAIIMETPMVHKVDKQFYDYIKTGMKIILDADSGEITILE
jgi:predicted aconitase with swiveling domain